MHHGKHVAPLLLVRERRVSDFRAPVAARRHHNHLVVRAQMVDQRSHLVGRADTAPVENKHRCSSLWRSVDFVIDLRVTGLHGVTNRRIIAIRGFACGSAWLLREPTKRSPGAGVSRGDGRLRWSGGESRHRGVRGAGSKSQSRDHRGKQQISHHDSVCPFLPFSFGLN